MQVDYTLNNNIILSKYINSSLSCTKDAINKNFDVLKITLLWLPAKNGCLRKYKLRLTVLFCSLLIMELHIFISLITLSVVNTFFFLSGIFLNTLVIVSFWRSTQLRQKLCYFMIMVLSCCDIFAVSTNQPYLAIMAMLWLAEKLDGYPRWVGFTLRLTTIPLSSSTLALLVMNLERYLATHYPIFHRTSVTKAKLLTLLAFLIAIEIILAVLSENDTVISMPVAVVISFALFTPPMLFTNYKLFTISRRSRRNRTSPETGMKKKDSFRNVSSCLLAVACFAILSIPLFIYIVLTIHSSKSTLSTLDSVEVTAALWAKTIASMNSTFNCLIFYWKNKILRTEGMKIIKGRIL